LDAQGAKPSEISLEVGVPKERLRRWLMPSYVFSGVECNLFTRIVEQGLNPSTHWWGWTPSQIKDIKRLLHPVTDDIRKQIMRLNKEGLSLKEIAQELGVSSRFTVSCIGSCAHKLSHPYDGGAERLKASIMRSLKFANEYGLPRKDKGCAVSVVSGLHLYFRYGSCSQPLPFGYNPAFDRYQNNIYCYFEALEQLIADGAIHVAPAHGREFLSALEISDKKISTFYQMGRESRPCGFNEPEEAAKLRKKGLSNAKIAAALGVTPQTVSKWLGSKRNQANALGSA
jgi:DNA-binding CsgD family transcriptional regulator